MKLIYIVMLGLVVQVLSGCASTPPNLRADRNLQQANPMKQITLLGSSSVYWPQQSRSASVLGLKSSQAGLENIMPLVKNGLESKGYKVMFAEPVVVGFPRAGVKNIVYADYDESGSESQWNQDTRNPTYIYPVFEDNEEVKAAAIDLLKGLENYIKRKKFNSYKPNLSSVQTVTAATESDTVCVVRAWGIRYTKARAVGAFFAGMLTGSHNDMSDRGEAVLSCISGEDGRVLWQKSYALSEDPMDIDQDKVNSALTYFPAFATNLTSDCEIHKQGKDLFLCD